MVCISHIISWISSVYTCRLQFVLVNHPICSNSWALLKNLLGLGPSWGFKHRSPKSNSWCFCAPCSSWTLQFGDILQFRDKATSPNIIVFACISHHILSWYYIYIYSIISHYMPLESLDLIIILNTYEVVGLVSLDWFRGTLAGNPYIDGKTMVSGVKFLLNQSIDTGLCSIFLNEMVKKKKHQTCIDHHMWWIQTILNHHCSQ